MIGTIRRALHGAWICLMIYLAVHGLRLCGALSFLPETNMAAAVQAMGGVLTGDVTAGEAVAVFSGAVSARTAQPVFSHGDGR